MEGKKVLLRLLAATAGALLSMPSVSAQGLSAQDILQRADEVRLPLAQRLVGQVSNGDIARANFAGDYTPRLVGMEKAVNDDLYVLDLMAVDRTVTYQRVRYWVRQANFRPYKAEFYSLSDRLLKSCRYDEFKALGGKARPTKLVMVDALNKGEESTLEYSSMKLREF